MSGFHAMLKMNFRLLFRNAGYLCFLIILPLTAVAILNLKLENVAVNGTNTQEIIYLEEAGERIEEMTGLKLNVKVYDLAVSKLSGQFLKSLQRNGNYQLYCYELAGNKELGIVEHIGENAAKEKAIKVMNENTVGAVLVILPDFDRHILSGAYESSLFFYYGKEDVRIDMLQSSINQFFAGADTFLAVTGEQQEDFEELLSKADKESITVRTESVGSNSGRSLTGDQLGQMSVIKYSWVIVTMAFTFSGVFISHTVIAERNNGVFKRIKLSGTGMSNYGLVKFCLVIVTVFIQIIVMGAGIKLFVNVNLGIGLEQYLLLTFGLALILNTMSVVIGIIVNNLLSTSYVAFIVGTISFMLSGLIFPMKLEGRFAKAALLTPQHWGAEAVEMLFASEKGVYSDYFLAVIAFLAVIFCAGFIGLNLIQREEL